MFLRSFVVLTFLMSTCFALDQNSHEAKGVMNNVYESFVKIIPYVFDEKNIDFLKDKRSKDELITNISNLSDIFKNAKHVEFFQKPGFRPSLKAITSHLDDTLISVQTNNVFFAQKRLRVVSALCISCHTQLNESISQNAFGDSVVNEKRSRFKTDFAFANYLFLVRRFTESINFFEKSIDNNLLIFKKNNSEASEEYLDKSLDINNALRRILTIHTKIFLSPNKAIAFLEKQKKKKNLPKTTMILISTWIKSLNSWKNFDTNSSVDVGGFINKYLVPLEQNKSKLYGEEADITLLISSGILSKYLIAHHQPNLTPEILYWLSISERRLSGTYFFSLSDLYLKDCVSVYPKNPFAKKCFQEYKDNLYFGYSGSAGTDIPLEEKQELDRLEKILK